MGKLLTVNDIAAAQDLPSERVTVPEWGGDVIIRALSAADREWFEMGMLVEDTVIGDDGKAHSVRRVQVSNARARLLSRAIVDEDGNALFDEVQMEVLGKKSNPVVQRLFALAQKLSAIGQESVDAAEKNSEAGPNDASSSA